MANNVSLNENWSQKWIMNVTPIKHLIKWIVNREQLSGFETRIFSDQKLKHVSVAINSSQIRVDFSRGQLKNKLHLHSALILFI